jgi:voltage-gated potassium channel
MFLIIGVGTMGYILIEKWNFFDSFYMTIITMSTVGFGEVHELSVEGRMFTAFLLISCFGLFAFTISSLTSYIVGGEYRINLRDFKIMKKMKTMENHVIICGFGRVGKQVALDLLQFGIPFVIVENDDKTIESEEKEGFLFIKGDSTNQGILETANIKQAKAIISCLPKDADNIYVVLSAREIEKRMIIVARATESAAVSKLKMAGANHVIMPDSIGGSHMAALISNPDVIEFMDAIKVQGHSGGINIEAIAFNELPIEFQNKTIGQLEAKRLTGVTIVGFKTPEGEYIINPDFEIEVVPKSQLFVLGSAEQIQKHNAIFGINQN